MQHAGYRRNTPTAPTEQKIKPKASRHDAARFALFRAPSGSIPLGSTTRSRSL